jgi:hypothetical protein
MIVLRISPSPEVLDDIDPFARTIPPSVRCEMMDEVLHPSEVGAANREIHLRESPSRVVGLLAEDRQVTDLCSMRLDELLALDEHPA